MLLSAISLATLLAVHVTKANNICDPNAQNNLKSAQTGNNYVIDSLSGIPFTYAIGQCTAIDLSGSGTYAVYTCDSGSDGTTSISRTTYSDSGCSQNPSTTTGYFGPTSQQMYGMIGYFDCSGVNGYAQVQIGTVDCNSLVTVYAGLGGCIFEDAILNSMGKPIGAIETQVYCDSDSSQAIVQLFTAGPIASTTIPPVTTTAMEMPSSSMAGMSSSMYGSSMYPEPSMYGESSSMIEMSSSMIAMSSSMIAMTTEEASTSQPVPPMCVDQFICSQWIFTTKCDSSTPNGELVVLIKGMPHKVPIFGMYQGCQAGSSKKKGASTLLAVTNLIVALAVALFSLF